MLPIRASGTATLMVVFADRTSTIPEPAVSFSDLSCEPRRSREKKGVGLSGVEWRRMEGRG